MDQVFPPQIEFRKFLEQEATTPYPFHYTIQEYNAPNSNQWIHFGWQASVGRQI